MAKVRDMSERQFEEALARHGAKLAYLLERRDYFQKQIDKEGKSA